jgi:hypothetical protein
MNTFNNLVLLILIIVIFLLVLVLKIFWDAYSTSITLKLLQNNSGNISVTKIIIWGFIVISIVMLFDYYYKRPMIRYSAYRLKDE